MRQFREYSTRTLKTLQKYLKNIDGIENLEELSKDLDFELQGWDYGIPTQKRVIIYIPQLDIITGAETGTNQTKGKKGFIADIGGWYYPEDGILWKNVDKP
jgi:hypothetical protein